jgi:glycosyltransferase involved in cell wall biosynthesis
LFLNASRWEDYGISQLEALSAGAALVTVPSPGPYEALPLARRLAPELVDGDFAAALRRGLERGEPELERYRLRAQVELAPYRPDTVLAVVRERVVPLIAGA